MFWYGDHMSGWGWGLMAVGMIAFWVLIIIAVVALFRSVTRSPHPPPMDTPEHLLAQRLARGEITEDEYQRTLALLRDRHRGRPDER